MGVSYTISRLLDATLLSMPCGERRKDAKGSEIKCRSVMEETVKFRSMQVDVSGCYAHERPPIAKFAHRYCKGSIDIGVAGFVLWPGVVLLPIVICFPGGQ